MPPLLPSSSTHSTVAYAELEIHKLVRLFLSEVLVSDGHRCSQVTVNSIAELRQNPLYNQYRWYLTNNFKECAAAGTGDWADHFALPYPGKTGWRRDGGGL